MKTQLKRPPNPQIPFNSFVPFVVSFFTLSSRTKVSSRCPHVTQHAFQYAHWYPKRPVKPVPNMPEPWTR